MAGFREMSALKRATEVVNHREIVGREAGGKAFGHPDHEAVVLEHGITYDPAFHAWADRLRDTRPASDQENPGEDLCTDVILELHNESGQLVITYRLFRCWASEYEAVPDLDANAVSIEVVKLGNEGWQRDDAVVEPTEPSFDETLGAHLPHQPS